MWNDLWSSIVATVCSSFYMHVNPDVINHVNAHVIIKQRPVLTYLCCHHRVNRPAADGWCFQLCRVRKTKGFRLDSFLFAKMVKVSRIEGASYIIRRNMIYSKKFLFSIVFGRKLCNGTKKYYCPGLCYYHAKLPMNDTTQDALTLQFQAEKKRPPGCLMVCQRWSLITFPVSWRVASS